ncbi:phytanoyl-CoA dioxygenase family protein [Thermostichus vulcanus]|uniref:Phytanoyl-CoA dioxygenase family protein n=1 Tax=Thermostichus vulcanus str. 'Rupite' TaxID=2813851 RepID=A0ABT0CCS4_THEVL|nr:phytanoyl-CoA dioxygenase family protein [Thermostichus vulcanus]MCJ2543551.1 phytanoyl-CoA dioxygenase family protein [Thermostichus vulcanus str. 'Rupite']
MALPTRLQLKSAMKLLEISPRPDPHLSQQIARDGVAVLSGILEPNLCTALIRAIDHLRAKPGPHFRTLSPVGLPVVQSDLFRWPEDATLTQVVTEGILPQLAASIFGTDSVVLLEDQFFYSEARAQTLSPWHQDHPYHPLEPWFLTFWIPLDPVLAGQGLRAVVGSHRGPLFAPVEFSAAEATLTAAGDTLAPVPDIDGDLANSRLGPEVNILAPPFEPGDVMILDSRTLHAGGKACPHPFRRISIRYAHPETHIVERAWPVAAFWQE